MSNLRPFVSVLTPTYNRRQFIPIAIACFKAQTYPQDRMEWIVLDDGTDKVGDLFAASGLKNVRYVALPDGEKLPIGAKRNMINELAKGDICVCWDDDDYYVPDRVRHAVQRLQGQKMAPVAGSTEIYMYFPDREEIWSAGPYNPNHATNGTMAYWRSYFKTHKYDNTAAKAEERQFMNDWKTPVAQLRPEQVMLVLNHGINTFDKRKMIHMGNKAIKKTSLKLNGFIKDKKIRDFYTSLRDKIPPYVHKEEGSASAAGGAGADVDIPALEVGETTQTASSVADSQVPTKEQSVRTLSLSEMMWSLSTEPAAVPPVPAPAPLSVPVPPLEPASQPVPESHTSDSPAVPPVTE
jgi:glycosyltransferase involved in cell wall biosynthesis